MKNLMITIMMSASIYMLNTNTLFAQGENEGPGDPINPDAELEVPIDDGIVWLMLAGVVYGVRKCMIAGRK